MTLRQPDSPKLISLSRLEEMDKAPADTYIGTAKIDGRRRTAYRLDGKWIFKAKNRDDCQEIPTALREEFGALQWDDGVMLDMEYSGPRDVKGIPRLHVFDVLMIDHKWLDWQYWRRYAWLYENWISATHIFMLEAKPNPGLVEMFQEQLTNPLSEGLVIRRADQVNIGHHEKSQENPFMWKCKYARLTERGAE